MPEVEVWRSLARELEVGGACALLAVVDSRGSAPGRRGAVMAVGPGGPLAGTIGGGVAEAALVDQVSADLRSGSLVPRRVPLAHREGAADASGMICGGSQVVVVAPLDEGDRAAVAGVVDAVAAGRTVAWSIDQRGWHVIAEAPASQAPASGPAAPEWSEVLRSGPTHLVHVVGAGHVGSALVPLLVVLDFRVVLVDERPGLASGAGTAAHERVALPYEDLAEIVRPGPDSFAAIMTHSHERDAVALATLESLELGYLGLLGSRAKVHRIVGDRVLPAWFHAPMGVPIGSATPAEIAVSIAAEMVSVRSAARRDTTG
jgi:xanthine dehydrogenase accessory factor